MQAILLKDDRSTVEKNKRIERTEDISSVDDLSSVEKNKRIKQSLTICQEDDVEMCHPSMDTKIEECVKVKSSGEKKCGKDGCKASIRDEQGLLLCKFHNRSSKLPVPNVLGEKLELNKEELQIERTLCRKQGCQQKQIGSRRVFCFDHITTEVNHSGKCYTICSTNQKNSVPNPNCIVYNDYQCDCLQLDRSMCKCIKKDFCASCLSYIRKA